MINTFKEILNDLEFTHGEQETYVALLELEESTIGPISSKAGITPAKTYLILDRLQDKGLISCINKNNVKTFRALHPQRLLTLINERIQALKNTKQQTEDILPQLINKIDNTSEQAAAVYEGIQGLSALYDEMIEYQQTSKEDFCAFTLGDEYSTQTNRFFAKYDRIRAQKGIRTKILAPPEQYQSINETHEQTPYLIIRKTNRTIPTGMFVFADSVVTLLWDEQPTAFRIISKQNAQAFRDFFEEVWQESAQSTTKTND